MNINIIEGLGSYVSYGKNEVGVLKSLYDRVPIDLRQDFESVLIRSCEMYHSSVAEAKSRGERPKAMALKKKAFDIVRDWYKKKGLKSVTDTKEVVRSSKPRIPGNEETPRVVQKQSYFADVNVMPKDIESVFDNFNSDELSDEAQIEDSASIELDLDANLFESEDILSGLDSLDGLEDF